MSFAKINIKVHPVVFRYIDNNFKKIDGTYCIEKSPLYYGMAAMLSRSNIQDTSKIGRKYSKFKEISIFVAKKDFFRYGYTIPDFQQYIFSKFMYEYILNEICMQIMYMHVYTGVPRHKSMKNVLLDNLFESDELNIEYLKKIYQRKYLEKESKIKSEIIVID